MEYMQGQKEDKGALTAYNAREDLIKSYRNKEEELLQKLDQERIKKNDSLLTLKAMKNYSKELKYLAEDWAPVGQPLPQVLTMPPPTRLDDEMVNHKMSSHHEEELDRLKKRNNRLEEDLRLMNDQLLGKAGVQPMNFSQNGGNKFGVCKILVFCPKKFRLVGTDLALTLRSYGARRTNSSRRTITCSAC